MKTKSKKTKAKPASPRVHTPAEAFAVVLDIRDKLAFLCEAKNREEIRREEAKRIARLLFAEAARLNVFPAPVAAAFREILG